MLLYEYEYETSRNRYYSASDEDMRTYCLQNKVNPNKVLKKNRVDTYYKGTDFFIARTTTPLTKLHEKLEVYGYR